jgi:hypothetical protein
MTILLQDKTNVSLRHINGRAKLTFHAIDKTIYLPVGVEVKIPLVETLYKALKA